MVPRAIELPRRPEHLLFLWGLTTGVEVDFVIDDMACAIEAKASRASMRTT